MKIQEIQKVKTSAVVAFIAGALSLSSCSKGSKAGEGGDAASSYSVAEVTVTQVTRAEIRSLLDVSGTIAAAPNQDVRVSSLVPGRVARIMVAEGDHVSRDQVLAKIEDGPFRDELQQAESAVEQVKATLENARLNRSRNENLFKRGIAAGKDLEDARTQESISEAVLRQAEAAQDLARRQLSRTEVRSPLTGTIVKRFVSVGEQVDGTATQPLFQVANLSEVELFANVPAVYLGKIHVAQTLPISTDAFPNKKFTGRVVAISPAVDPSTNIGLVRIRISNQAGLLRWGMFLMAQIPIETHANARVVPREAVYRDAQGQPHVYRVQGESAVAVPVKLGLETQERLELLSGVQEGETVILSGGYGLGQQAKIKVRP